MRRLAGWLLVACCLSLALAQAASPDVLELSQLTCAHDKPDDTSVTGLSCFVPKSCLRGTYAFLMSVLPEVLNSCNAMVAIRPDPGGTRWLVILQLRGSDVKHADGIELFYEKADATLNTIVKCTPQEPVGSDPNNNPFTPRLGRHKFTSGRSICEVYLSHTSSFGTILASGKLGIKFTDSSDTIQQFSEDYSTLSSTLQKATNCPLLERGNYGGDDKTTTFQMQAFEWRDELTCIVPGESEFKPQLYEMMFKTEEGSYERADRVSCTKFEGKYYKHEVFKNGEPKRTMTSTHLAVVCVAKACSLCDKSACQEENCAVLDAGAKGACAELKCPSGIYSADGGDTFYGAPVCQKTPEAAARQDRVLKSIGEDVQWILNGAAGKDIRCGSSVDCPQPLLIQEDSRADIKVTAESAVCTGDGAKMIYTDGGAKDVEVTRLDCDRTKGIWNQVLLDQSVQLFANFTLRCQNKKEEPVAESGMNVYVFCGVGVLLIIIVVIVIVICCWRRRKAKKGSAETVKGITNEVSEPKEKKISPTQEASLIVTALPTGPASTSTSTAAVIPTAAPPTPKDKKVALVAASADQISDEKKKQFLKYDDSGVSEKPSVSKKTINTTLVDLTQLDKVTHEEKKGDSKQQQITKGKSAPKLEDATGDWKVSQEEMSKKNSQKSMLKLQQAPPDDGQYEVLPPPTLIERTAANEKTMIDVDDDDFGSEMKKSARTANADLSKKAESGLKSREQKVLDLDKILNGPEDDDEPASKARSLQKALTSRKSITKTKEADTQLSTDVQTATGKDPATRPADQAPASATSQSQVGGRSKVATPPPPVEDKN